MRKIKCVFKFDDNHKVTREPTGLMVQFNEQKPVEIDGAFL